VFRVALLPHPLEGEGLAGTLAWGSLSLGLFVIYHPLAGRTWYPNAKRVFHDPRFLVQCTLARVGLPCRLQPQRLDLAATADPLAGGHGLARAPAGTPAPTASTVTPMTARAISTRPWAHGHRLKSSSGRSWQS